MGKQNMRMKSYLLCDKHLRHISKERIEQLVKHEILELLCDDLIVCIDCLKGKFTKLRNKYANRFSTTS